MMTIDSLSAACAVIVNPAAEPGFRHLATAWQVAAGEWLTVWNDEEPPPSSCRLLLSHSGRDVEMEAWEQDEMGPIAGFRAPGDEHTLAVAGDESPLHKRQLLMALGYPSVIDHPTFAIHRGSLTPERYHPYLCPWLIQGHVALFTLDQGWLAGACYHGMNGAPVVNQDGAVVGLIDGEPPSNPSQPPLTRFRRIGA